MNNSNCHQNLSDEKWTRTTIDAVHLAFLSAERQTIEVLDSEKLRCNFLIESPDLNNQKENDERKRLLYSWRGPVLSKIPSDTRWFEVNSLRSHHFSQLHAIGGNCGWDSVNDNNQIFDVAKRIPFELDITNPPSNWDHPIIWGHTENGPFTIIEGNHRLVALAGSKLVSDIEIPIYVGLSSSVCCWHMISRWT